MAEDNRLIAIMAEMLAEVRDIKTDLRDLKHKSEERFDRLAQQQAKTNLALGELRLSVMGLADRIEKLLQLDQRVKVLEDLMLPNGPRKAA